MKKMPSPPLLEGHVFMIDKRANQSLLSKICCSSTEISGLWPLSYWKQLIDCSMCLALTTCDIQTKLIQYIFKGLSSYKTFNYIKSTNSQRCAGFDSDVLFCFVFLKRWFLSFWPYVLFTQNKNMNSLNKFFTLTLSVCSTAESLTSSLTVKCWFGVNLWMWSVQLMYEPKKLNYIRWLVYH